MFFEYRSKSIYPLRKKLSEQVRSEGKDSPLKPSWIVVQNREAREWITYQLAGINGIAANIEFILPSELIWKLFRFVKKDLPKILPSDRLPMQWSVFELLSSKRTELEKAGFPFKIGDESLRLQLASQIADVFDLYQVYRPYMIKSWTNRKLTTKNKHEIWQSVLWNFLHAEWNDNELKLPDRSEAFFILKEKLAGNNSLLNSIPDHIHIFGLSQSSGPFLDILNTLAQQKDIHFYTGVFDQPESIKNHSFKELIQEWSESKNDTLQVLSQYQTHQSDLNSSDQNLIITLLNKESEVPVQVHSCHNVRREVEVLKTELLCFLDVNPEVSLDEILILVPDMEQYVSVINSVMSFDEGEPSIPIGLPFVSNENIASLLINLIELVQSDFKVSSVLDLLESEPVRTRFKLEIDDISMLRSWLKEMNIHWGLEAKDSGYSMERAIHSAFNGFAMETEDFTVYQSTVPFGEVNSTDKLIILAKASEYIESLKQIKKGLDNRQTAGDWVLLVKEWFLELFSREKTTSLLLSFEKWIKSVEYARNQSEISFSTFSEWIKGQLNDVSAGSGRFGNGVQLSTYIPFRGLPFKYVAILGLNEGVFPRNPVRPAFDLIQADPKPGERIMAKDDRLLFLEILYSTREKLNISYLEKDQHSENERLPSILVQKLIDALKSIDKGFEVTEHKLHGFDSSIFMEPKVYSNHQKSISEKIGSGKHPDLIFLKPEDLNLITFNESELYLNNLISFFEQPCKYHAHNVLQISSRTNDVVLSDRENFKLDGLSRYSIRQEIVSGLERDISESHLFEYLNVSGSLPKGIPGNKLFKEQFTEITELVDLVTEYRNVDSSDIEIDLLINEIKLYGHVDDIYGSRRIVYRAGSSRAKDLVSLWISHLICSVIRSEFYESILVYKEKKNSKTVTSVHKLTEVKDPLSILEGLVSWFTQAYSDKSRLCFFPESSLEFISSEGEPDKLTMWYGQDHGYNGDGNDFYNELYWRGTDPLNEQYFKNNAEQFWTPLLSVLTETNPGE